MMQSVAGGAILVFWIALNSASASWRPILAVLARVLSLAVSQILPGHARADAAKNCRSGTGVIVVALVALSIVTSMPSSTP